MRSEKEKNTSASSATVARSGVFSWHPSRQAVRKHLDQAAPIVPVHSLHPRCYPQKAGRSRSKLWSKSAHSPEHRSESVETHPKLVEIGQIFPRLAQDWWTFVELGRLARTRSPGAGRLRLRRGNMSGGSGGEGDAPACHRG